MLIVAQNFQVGGIQRSLINMLEILSEESNIDIDLFVFGDGPLLKEVPKSINIIQGKRSLRLITTPMSVVNKSKKVLDIFIRISFMVKVRLRGSKTIYQSLFKKEKRLKKYDIAISYFNDVPGNYFNQGTNQYVDEFVKAKKKVAWIHTDPVIANFDKNECKLKYKNFDQIVCVSNACSNKFKEFLPEYANKVETVYNVFPINKIKILGSEKLNQIKDNKISLVTVARIDNTTKRINIIPEIVNKLVKNNIKNFKWTVVGDGPDLVSITERVKDLGIGNYVELVGNKSNPYPYIKSSSLFVLVSKFEGYPMVICESLILGTPVLTTNFAAASEQISNGDNGIITSFDEDSIFYELHRILKDRNEIEKMERYISNNLYSNTVAKKQLKSILEIKDE
ncbi:glycosyltransferase [Heyndrickxia acidicola]|uniref:Glycosyltransferase n=2 Tax=Heyndrickxia acidicola TaxID=209389 RepID=A0ABU6MJ70_9BACI|nr:glycosyltransferase [Heyndrickxia acidicola]